MNLMESRSMTAAQLTREAGLTAGLISQWKKGAQKPSSKSLQKIADYFHVSVDYLLTGKEASFGQVPSEWEEDAIDEQLRDVNFALSGEVHELTLSEKKDVLNFIKFVKAQRAMKDEKEGQQNGHA
ncbi:MAG: helix-turn-helix domain-containing protein [Ethanoligenens sp.]